MCDDDVLISECQSGNISAFEALVRKYQDRTVRVLYLLLGNVDDAQDVAQESFIRAFRGIHSFRRSSSFATWLHRIALNTAHNWIRDNRQPETLPLHEERRFAGYGRPEDLLVARERALEIRSLLAELPESYREAIVLRHFEDLSYVEIAEVQGVPVGTVKSRLAKARSLLQKSFLDGSAGTERMDDHGLQDGEEAHSSRSGWRAR
ncbi:MAG: sigma-70 family RNA polymerase sigma factor [Armatimonadetes bacterium]|nr:sigma-70 family RNA polymerase sigma factor [Armatimonadota bacterium]